VGPTAEDAGAGARIDWSRPLFTSLDTSSCLPRFSFDCLSSWIHTLRLFKRSSVQAHCASTRPDPTKAAARCMFRVNALSIRGLSQRLHTLSQCSRRTSEVKQLCLLSGPTPAPVGSSPPRSCVRPQHRHTPVNPRFSGASRRSGQSYGLVHPPLQSVSTRRGTMRWELINHLSSRRTKARPAVNGANAIMSGTFNSWPSQTYLPAGVPECPQQCSAWYLRNKHPSQTCSCVPDRA